MRAYEEKASRPHHVRMRMAQLCEYLEEWPSALTKDCIDELGRHARADLQRLWEDGRVVRYKCPDVSVEFGVSPRAWYWVTVEEAERWEIEDAALPAA